MKYIDRLKKLTGSKFKINELMSKHTTLEIGGHAMYFLTVKNQEDLINCIKVANKNKLNYLVIGGGSNLLVSENGFNGLIIKNEVSGIEVNDKKVTIKSGTILFELIKKLNTKGLSGMEKMAGIPGTVGGAIYGNAGAYGQTISDCLVSVRVFNGKKIKNIKKKDCKFSYRDSLFKNNNNTILEAEFEFNRSLPEILQKTSLNTIQIRLQKYPQSLKCPGSFFKNIITTDLKRLTLDKIPQEKIVYGKVSAGYLMETVGAKGAQKGNVKIVDYHGNLIINLGDGLASDFYDLAFKYAKKVKEKYGVSLKPEVQLVGFDSDFKV